MNTQRTGGRSAWSRLSDHLEENSEGFGPLRGTLGVGRIGMIWLAANLVVTTLLTGTLFVPGVSWPVALGMIVLGTLVGAAVLVLVGNMGTRTGLATMALTRGSFGLRGSFLPVAANVVILMGWSWVHAMLAGIGITIALQQIHVLLGGSSASSAWENVTSLPAGIVVPYHSTSTVVRRSS